MNRFVSLFAATTLILASPPLPIEAATRGQETGQISGWVSAGDRPVRNVTARLRSIQDGQLVAIKTCDDSGIFVFVGVPAGTYLVEVVSPAGAILGTSAPVSLGGGVTAVRGVTVGISPTAAAAAGGGRSSKVAGFFDLARRPFTSVLGITVLSAAAATGISGIIATRDDTSASR